MTDAAPRGNPLRILVVEDDVDLADLLVSHLRRLGHRVDAVTSGEAAMDAVRADVPDVVVCDIVLPGIDGTEVVHRLRSDAATAGCLVVMTSVLDLDTPGELARLGADAILPKPFSRRDVAAVMASLQPAVTA